MKILVCIKQILDPDLPARDFRINSETREAERGNANLVTNIFCENAIETALQLKEKVGECTVTALCYGPESAEDSLRKALAMTVDEAVLVAREGCSNPDAESVGKVLAAAIRHLGEYDLILVGRESGDWGVGQTGAYLTEELDLPMLGFVDSIEPAANGLRVQRQTDVGFEIAEVQPPALLLITNADGNVPRIPKTRDVMMSYRKPLQKLSLADIGASEVEQLQAGNSAYEVVELYIPGKDVECEFVEGDTLDERVDALAAKIHDAVAKLN